MKLSNDLDALSALRADESVKRSRRASIFRLVAAFGFFAFLMLSIRAYFAVPLSFDVIAPRRLIVTALATLLCLGMAVILDRLRDTSFCGRVICGLVGALMISILVTLFSFGLNHMIAPLPHLSSLTVSHVVQWTMAWFGYTLAWTGTHLALIYHWEAEDRLRRVHALQGYAQKAKIAALENQISPHFLFNALNSISALVLERRTELAEAMLLNLSHFIRAAPERANDGMISLHEEIRLLQLYLSIEEVRFHDRMRVEINVPEPLRSVRVPSLILQPLAENAVRYGVGRSESLTTISITALQRNRLLVVTVEDNGMSCQTSSGGSGLGLQNVRERLQAHFGSSASLTTGPRPEAGYRAAISLPISAAP